MRTISFNQAFKMHFEELNTTIGTNKSHSQILQYTTSLLTQLYLLFTNELHVNNYYFYNVSEMTGLEKNYKYKINTSIGLWDPDIMYKFY